MKNKFLTAFIAIVLMACISTGFLACRKSTSVSNEPQAIGTVQKVAESILEDSLFTNLILDFMNESIILNENKNDTSLIRISNERIAASLINFVINQKDYSKMNELERNKVLKFIIDSTKSKTYLLNNPAIQTNINNISIISNRSLIQSNNINGSPVSLKLTNDEIINCFLDAAINALGFYGEALAEITGMVRSGASNSAIIRLGLDILKNASPWWKVGAIVFQFSNCIYQGI